MNETEKRAAADVIRFWGCWGAAADEKIAGLLSGLEEQDAEAAEKWRGIVDYWRYVQTGMRVHFDQVPEALPEDDSLCFAVLGYGLNPDGTIMDELAGRLRAALRCARQYPNALILCTGGGTASENPSATEAGRMGEWLEQNGVEKRRLILEEKSLSTAENALFSTALLLARYPHVRSVVMVSSSYHVGWGALLFESAFRLAARQNPASDCRVVSNFAYPIDNERFLESDLPRWQTGGMLELIGEKEAARAFYRGQYEKPAL